MSRWIAFMGVAIVWLQGFELQAQTNNYTKDATLTDASLKACVQYALQHKPFVQQAVIDEQITNLGIKGKLADWYPQLGFDYNVQHNFQLPSSFANGNFIQSGALNSSAALFSVNQTIFNKDVLLAKRSATDVQQQAKQNIENNKIQLVVTVSKAFYDVLLTNKQIELIHQNINRLQSSYKNAYNQYKGGIVDKIDYQRASIALNNAQAQQKSLEELLKAKLAILKNAMGYLANNNFTLQYDTTQLEQELNLDTAKAVNYSNRIEYQQLTTLKRLQAYNLDYYKWNYYPSVSAYGNYNLNFLNNDFAKLYGHNYPNSFMGLRLSLPIYQGNKRVYQTRAAELALKRIDWNLLQLRSSINTQYEQALAAYKSNLYNYQLLKDNLLLSQEVYNTIQLQYKSGIKNYLEVITAETDLRSSQVNYTNALYQLLSAKIDVQQALGEVRY